MPPELLGPFEVHQMPSKVTVYYREKDHSYWTETKRRGKEWSGSGRLTGVSTVVGPFDFRPDNLMKYAARRNGDGIAMLAADCLSLEDADDIRSALQWLTSGESIWEALSDAKLLYSDLTDRAAARGTNVHKHGLHALARGETLPALAQLTDEERGYVKGIMRFWRDHNPEPLQAEQVVADMIIGCAGRLDLRAKLHGEWRGQQLRGAVCLLDAKTSGFIPNKHHVQVAGYDLLADLSGFGRAERLFILQVTPGGEYELLPVHATDVDFDDAVRVYRRAAAIGNQARKDREAGEKREPVAA